MIERAVEQRPQDGFIVDSLGWALYRLDDYQGAVRYLERAVELEPGDPVINDHLGDAYWQVGRRTEARYQWERAITLSDEGDDELKAPIQAKLNDGLDAGG
jgi:Flp pilus assembly protein TadD